MAWRSIVLSIYYVHKNEFPTEIVVNNILSNANLLSTDNLNQAIEKITYTIKKSWIGLKSRVVVDLTFLFWQTVDNYIAILYYKYIREIHKQQ